MVSFQYRMKMGRKLDLKNPTRFSEKVQWYKLFYRDPVMPKCVDKYEVREYLESKGFGSLLNECYGVYNTVDEIDFDKLPNSFVLKNTLGSGGNSVIVVPDKSKLDIEATKNEMRQWFVLQTGLSREWVYHVGKPRIIAEKFLEGGEHGLIDYKFFSFYGKIDYLYVICDRTLGGLASFAIVDKNYNLMDITRVGEPHMEELPAKPENFDEMLEIASQMSKDFPCLRVDFYNVGGKIVFGELTFYTASGYVAFEPDEFDFELGKLFKLPEIKK